MTRKRPKKRLPAPVEEPTPDADGALPDEEDDELSERLFDALAGLSPAEQRKLLDDLEAGKR